jgi:hypothetical protein
MTAVRVCFQALEPVLEEFCRFKRGASQRDRRTSPSGQRSRPHPTPTGAQRPECFGRIDDLVLAYSILIERLDRTHPASTPGKHDGLPRGALRRQQRPWTVGSPSNSTRQKPGTCLSVVILVVTLPTFFPFSILSALQACRKRCGATLLAIAIVGRGPRCLLSGHAFKAKSDPAARFRRPRTAWSGGQCRTRLTAVWTALRSLAPMRAPGCRYFVRLGITWPKWRQQ